MQRENYLFNRYDLAANLRKFTEDIPKQVNAIPETQFLASSDADVVQNIVAKNAIMPLTLYPEQAVADKRETQIDVSGWRDRDWDYGRRGPLMIAGTSVEITIPYTGQADLWQAKTNTWSTVSPSGNIHASGHEQSGILTLTFTQPHDSPPEKFKQDYDRELLLINQYVGYSKIQVEAFNASLPQHVQEAVTARRKRLEKHSGIADILGLPIKPRDGAPSIVPIRVEPKIVVPLPPAPKSGLKPEPGITDELYEAILSIVRHEGRTFESAPGTFNVHDEEGLRNILLAHLNGHFQGAATGETFRRVGKTDIRIESENRAAFVAECKVWRGQAELMAAIDQLTGYLTWRDCKAAVVVFNKEVKGFTELLERVPEIAKAHPRFISATLSSEAGEWQFVFRSGEDEGRRIRLRVFLFNLYGG